MPEVHVIAPGLLTTIQDVGRYGYQHFGMPVSGAMDKYSLMLANILVGNSPSEACLEATLTGPELAFQEKGMVAICGADMGAMLNHTVVPLYTALRVKPGDVLRFSGLKKGCRTYIAFGGGIDVPEVMGSKSTYLRSRTGGMKGRQLQSGDILRVHPFINKPEIQRIPPQIIPDYLPSVHVHIIPGPETEAFSFEGIKEFLTKEYIVSAQSDRMGYRLTGPEIRHKKGADIISSGINMGTVQVPGNGQPIIMMADGQTTGGYTRIANVIMYDHTLLAQLKPGDKIRFREISLEKAQELHISRTKQCEKLIT